MNLINTYLKEIGDYKVLTADEEKNYARLYIQGREAKNQLTSGENIENRAELEDLVEQGQWAREMLINHNLKLVVSIAKKYSNGHLELGDLINEGNIGLVTAVDKFNPELGWRFSTCATPWIKQAITKSIIDKGKTIRIPAHIYQMLSKYRQVVEKLGNSGKHFTNADIAVEMGITEEKVDELQFWKQDAVSLETPLGDDEEDSLLDLQPDLNGENPTDYMERKDLEEYVQKLLSTLKPRTQQIMKMRFGLGKENDPADWAEEHTLEEIGAAVHLTRERVRQIINETIQDLRGRWKY